MRGDPHPQRGGTKCKRGAPYICRIKLISDDDYRFCAAREPYFQTVHGPLDPSLEYDGAAAAATAYVADADALGAWDAAMAEDDDN